MNADWSTSPSARRVQQHAGDARPAWLWSSDGQVLLWRNAASSLFLAKLKKHGLKLAPLATPIKGQVARNIRLGSLGRTSLARIQFLAGEKAVSSTCAATPLEWEDGQTALLIVGVDPIDADILEAAAEPGEVAEARPAEAEVAEAGDPQGAAPEQSTVEPAQSEVNPEPEPAPAAEPPADILVPEQVEEDAGEIAEAEDAWTDDAAADVPAPPLEAERRDGPSRLSRLVSDLSASVSLFTPLNETDDRLQASEATPSPEVASPASEAELGASQPQLWRITGRGFRPSVDDVPVPPDEPEQIEAEADLERLTALDEPPLASPPDVPVEPEILPPTPPDAEAVERVSRYNFDELSRILNDRVSETASSRLPALSEPQRGGSLINLGGETLVLNRLPLGILVFRDQQVLFANRAITEMVGYASVEDLRQAGLAAVFPSAGPDGQEAGPVNHLVQRDGTLVPVTARLQSISWQGRPALMLSASATEVRTGHETAVRAFAASLADIRGDGFIETNRAGVVSAVTPLAATLLGQAGPIEGKPLSALVDPAQVEPLREFLDRPARFAETARPFVAVPSLDGKAEITLFALGQAGIIAGYFGFVRNLDTSAPPRLTGPGELDPALLARISRGVRRPLNTIVGFAELLRTQAFGALGDERYGSYAGDIAAAGQEIEALVDELDDFTRLRDGRYLPERASLDLTSLLETCVLRVRQQANASRVIIRNAISENLPRITADRASLEQAVLNLLASAIDQTPTGGAVVISAQFEDDGGIAIHVRDTSTNSVDMGERFVVFRDGMGKNGQALAPVRSSIGLALTRSLLSVNAFSLSVDPAGQQGMLFSMTIPADMVESGETPRQTE